MPPMGRLGVDRCGGNTVPPVANTVLVNGIPAAHLGTGVVPHYCKSHHCRRHRIVQSVSTVFVENIPAVHLGHIASCGCPLTSGSPNVFVSDETGGGGSVPTRTSTLFTYGDSKPAVDSPKYTGTPTYNKEYDNKERAQEKPNQSPDFEAPPVQDQPITKCESGGNNILPFLQKCLQEAKSGTWRETGQSGGTSNPNILNMWKNIGCTFNSDQVPWCAGFACFAMKQSGMKWIREPGARNLANSFSKYGGKEVPISDMRPGDLVLWSSGHVNFCYTGNGQKATFVGGNQQPNGASGPPVRDPKNDGDVTISWPNGWTPAKGGIAKVIRLEC